MKAKTRKRLCNADCNNCEAMTNPQVALLLNVLALKFGEQVWHIANRVCANLTVCPVCRVDDFCHLDDDDGAFFTPISRIKAGHRTRAIAEQAVAILKEF